MRTVRFVDGFYRALAALAVPAGVLAAAYLLVPFAGRLPSTLEGLRVHGPYVMLALGIIVSLVFRRGRVLFALFALGIAYVSYRALLQYGIDGRTARTAFAALCLFVPLNLGALSLLRERGIFNPHGAMRLGALTLQVALTAWLARIGADDMIELAYAPIAESAVRA